MWLDTQDSAVQKIQQMELLFQFPYLFPVYLAFRLPSNTPILPVFYVAILTLSSGERIEVLGVWFSGNTDSM